MYSTVKEQDGTISLKRTDGSVVLGLNNDEVIAVSRFKSTVNFVIDLRLKLELMDDNVIMFKKDILNLFDKTLEEACNEDEIYKEPK